MHRAFTDAYIEKNVVPKSMRSKYSSLSFWIDTNSIKLATIDRLLSLSIYIWESVNIREKQRLGRMCRLQYNISLRVAADPD